MSQRLTRWGAAILVITGLGLLAGCGGGSDSKKPKAKASATPAGIISTKFGRGVDLDITRKQFMEQAEVQPVKTTTEHQDAEDQKIKGVSPRLRKKLIEKFGQPRNGVIHIPARDYECLLYRGEQPDKFSWKFCFDEKDTLQYVVTGNPI